MKHIWGKGSKIVDFNDSCPTDISKHIREGLGYKCTQTHLC